MRLFCACGRVAKVKVEALALETQARVTIHCRRCLNAVVTARGGSYELMVLTAVTAWITMNGLPRWNRRLWDEAVAESQKLRKEAGGRYEV